VLTATLVALAGPVSFAVLPVAPAGAASLAVASVASTPAFSPSWATVPLDLDAPDPHVVRAGSRYYAYTTGTTWGNHLGILTSTSPDVGWTTLTGTAFGSSAFPSVHFTEPVRAWQVAGMTHAPGVFARGGRYVMYYGAQTAGGHGGHFCLSVATSSGPAGPFTDVSDAPWLCMDAQGGTIDPAPFVDGAGRAWLLFKTNDGVDPGSPPAAIWSIALSADGLRAASFPRMLVSQSALSRPWETVENPQMLSEGGETFLLYSRGDWSGAGYRQGFAVCEGAVGPCHEGRPSTILASYGDVRGPGGGSVFRDASGAWRIAYHGWNGAPACVGYTGTACARKLYVGRVHVETALHTTCAAVDPVAGYRLAASDGGVFTFGNLE
jgi:beta-xylosidase